MAVGWYDRKMKLFIASTSRTTDAFNPAYKKHYRVSTAADRTEAPFVVYYREVKRPAVVEQYFDGANAIDIHAQSPQTGRLGARTTLADWWHRNFATIIGIRETDAFLAFQRFHPNKTLTTNLSHREFTELLTFKASINLAGSAKHLRARISTVTPVQALQTHAAYIVNSHTLKGIMRT